MAKDLDIVERQMKVGQTKVISRDGGRIVDYVELLFSPTTKIQFAPSEDRIFARFSVKDVDLPIPQLECDVSKPTIRDLILGLQSVYNQLKEDGEKK